MEEEGRVLSFEVLNRLVVYIIRERVIIKGLIFVVFLGFLMVVINGRSDYIYCIIVVIFGFFILLVFFKKFLNFFEKVKFFFFLFMMRG